MKISGYMVTLSSIWVGRRSGCEGFVRDVLATRPSVRQLPRRASYSSAQIIEKGFRLYEMWGKLESLFEAPSKMK